MRCRHVRPENWDCFSRSGGLRPSRFTCLSHHINQHRISIPHFCVLCLLRTPSPHRTGYDTQSQPGYHSRSHTICRVQTTDKALLVLWGEFNLSLFIWWQWFSVKCFWPLAFGRTLIFKSYSKPFSQDKTSVRVLWRHLQCLRSALVAAAPPSRI